MRIHSGFTVAFVLSAWALSSTRLAVADETTDVAELQAALVADSKATATPQPTPEPEQQNSGNVLSRAIQSLNPDISFILDVAGSYFSTNEPLMAGGHDPKETGLKLQQLEMAISSMVDPYFRFDANLVFLQDGVELEEAYGTTLTLPWNLQVRAGKFKARYGRMNAMHLHTWDFVDQVLILSKFFGGESHRGLGGEVSALLPLPWYVELVASFTEAQGEGTARSFFGAEDPGVHDPLDFVFIGAVKQFFPLSDNWSLSWGLSAANGPNSGDDNNRTDIWGTDLYLKYRPITYGSYTTIALQAEWMFRRRQLPTASLKDHGLYAYLLWRFSRRWATAARYEYVSGVSDDPLDPAWDGLRQRISTNITFWPTEFSRLRLQYNYDRPQWQKDYHAVLLAIEFAVGAHGAHKF